MHLRGIRHEIRYQFEEFCSNLGVSRILSQSGHRKERSKLMINWVGEIENMNVLRCLADSVAENS